MSKNNYVIPAEILEVLGPPPLLGSENPKRWNETLARFAQSYPPKDADDFEGWKNVWNLACDHWEEERMKRLKVEVLETTRRAKLEQELLKHVDKFEDEIRLQALEQAIEQFGHYGYGPTRRRAKSNEELPAETKGLRAEADPKLPAEAQTVPAVTATEPEPLLPPATDADYADAFAEYMHVYYCADQIQNSARKRYDAVRVQIDLRRAAELASKMINGEVAPTQRQLQTGEGSCVEHLSESAPTTTSVLLSSIQPFTPDASVPETSMSVRSTQLLDPPSSPEPQESSAVSTASAVGAAPVIEPSIAVGETSRSASSPPQLEAPNLAESQDSSEAPIGSTLDVVPVVDLSTTVGETTRSASSPHALQVPNSSESQESSEVSAASAIDVTPAIEPFTGMGEGGPARLPPGMDTSNIESNNVATDPSLATPPAAASSPPTSVTSTAMTASVESVTAGAVMPEPTPAAERKDERDRVESPGALVQPSQQHRVASAQKESETDRNARINAWIRKERARRAAERAHGRSR